MARWVRWLPLVALASLAGKSGVAGEGRAGVEPLVDDTLVEARLNRGEPSWTRALTVPEGATTLRVFVTSHQDVDLYLRRNAPVEDNFPAEADAKSNGDGGNEHVDVAAEPGTWYLTVAHPGSDRGGADFAVVAFLEGVGRAQLVLGPSPVQFDVREDGRPFKFRTWFPPDAEALTIETYATVALTGPDKKTVTANVTTPLVLRRDEGHPAGVYTGELRPFPGTTRATDTLSIQTANRKAPTSDWVPVLGPGVEEEFSIGGENKPSKRTFRVEIAEGSPGFSIACLADPGSDFDLYARRGTPMRTNDDEAEYMGLTSGTAETLVVGGDAPLAAGVCFVDVVTVDVDKAAHGTLVLSPLDRAAGKLAAWGKDEPPALEPGAWSKGLIITARSAFSWRSVEVPAGAAVLHAQVVDSTSPVDLVLARRDSGAIVRRSLTERVDESMEVAFGPDAPAPGLYLLGVLNRTLGEEEIDFRVAVGLGKPPTLPTDLRFPPFHEGANLRGPEKAAQAVVEIVVRGNGGGSGTCVTPGGLLLSCRHVFEGTGAKDPMQTEGILVAFPDEFDRPPRQLYVARVVDSDDALDLALLEITGDVYGRPLPENPRLPYVELGDSKRLAIGDPLVAVGYPEAGSEHTRTGVIVTRGTVSGLESSSQGQVWIKTDAWISNGHSGGAVVTDENRLVGIPSATLGSVRSLGLVRPVSRLPSDWKTRIDKVLGRK